MAGEKAIRLHGIGVKFRLMHERVSTLKETVINLLLRRRYVYEDLWALREVDFEVEKGTSVGVIGRNGSGKSTLLRTIAGILEPVEGTVSVEGEVSSLLELGAGFDPELTGTDNVYLTGSLLGVSRRLLDQQFAEIVGFSGLGQFIDVPVKSYSAGMYVRLAFSIAVHVDPDILLIDEILAVGDEAFQKRCLDRIRRFRRAGKTLVIVSHALDLLAQLCDRLILLEGGRVEADGVPRDVIDRYHRVLAAHEMGVDAHHPLLRGREKATGSARIEGVEILDGAGRPAEAFAPAAPARVQLTYSPPPDELAIQAAVGFFRGEDLVWLASTEADAFRVPAGEGSPRGLALSCEALPLDPGQYELRVAIYDKGDGDLFDLAEGREIAILGTGRGAGPAAAKCSWSAGEEAAG